jgi:hypothetical protein
LSGSIVYQKNLSSSQRINFNNSNFKIRQSSSIIDMQFPNKNLSKINNPFISKKITDKKMTFANKYSDKSFFEEKAINLVKERESITTQSFQMNNHFVFFHAPSNEQIKYSIPFSLFEALPINWGINIDQFDNKDGTLYT